MPLSGFAQKVSFTFVVAASPPDVRRGYASPFNLRLRTGCAPGSGFAPGVYGPKAEPGAQPHQPSVTVTARQSLASHRAAKPQQNAP